MPNRTHATRRNRTSWPASRAVRHRRAANALGVVSVWLAVSCGGRTLVEDRSETETAPDGGAEQAPSASSTVQTTTASAMTAPVVTAAATTTPLPPTSTSRPAPTVPQPTAVPMTSAAATATSAPTAMPSMAPTASWVPIEDPTADLMNCAVKNTVQGDKCTLDMRCDDTTVSSLACEDNGDGKWRCWCYNYETSQRLDYFVAGADAAESCGAGIPLCLPDSDLVLADSVCAQQHEGSDGYCRDTLDCTRSAFVDGDVEVQLIDKIVSGCEESPEGFFCSCDGYNRDERLSVVNATADVACETTAAICRDDLQASGATVCVPTALYEGSDQCSRSWQCGTPLDLATQDPANADAAQFLLGSGFRSVSCSPGQGGAVYCECSSPYVSQGGTVTLSDPSLSAACDSPQALALCDTVEFIPEGELICSDPGIQASEWSCTAGDQCTQPGRLGDVMIGKTGGLETQCERDTSADDWTCYCTSHYTNFVSDNMTISGDRELEACSDAFEQCRGLAVYVEENGVGAFRFDLLPDGVTDAGVP
jgi:hypothetical protein